jgi:hypothetical protein
MKKVVVIIIGLFVCLGFFSGAVYAQHHGRFHGGGFHGGGPRVSIHGYFGFPFYYPYRGYPYYYPYAYPELYINTEPPVNIEPQQTYYWYYCGDPKGYYPYITSCPGGWTRVVPTPPPPGKEGVVK